MAAGRLIGLLVLAAFLLVQATSSCNEFDVQLTKKEGQLEVCHKEEWGGVCNEIGTFDNVSAEVICYILNLSGEHAEMKSCFNRLKPDKVWWTNVTCSGTEETFDKCKKERMTGYCSDYYYPCVKCPERCGIRLTNDNDISPFSSFGRLQIFYNKKWSDICVKSGQWTTANSEVACRQMGLGKPVYGHTIEDFPDPKYNHIAADPSLNCTGNKQYLKDCKKKQWIPNPGAESKYYINMKCAGAPVQFPQATSSGPHSIKVEWSVDQRVLFYPVVTGYLVNVTDQHTNTHVKNITVPSQNSTVHYSHVVSSLQPSTEYSITICAVMESGDHGPTNSTIERTGESTTAIIVGTVVGILVILVLSAILCVGVTACVRCKRRPLPEGREVGGRGGRVNYGALQQDGDPEEPPQGLVESDEKYLSS